MRNKKRSGCLAPNLSWVRRGSWAQLHRQYLYQKRLDSFMSRWYQEYQRIDHYRNRTPTMYHNDQRFSTMNG